MKVDTTPVITGNRKSVRITTDNTFTRMQIMFTGYHSKLIKSLAEGIWVMDATHMPQGCGTWP